MAGSRLRLMALIAVAAAMGIGIFATAASAAFRANSVVPVFCSNDTIPANTELSVRLRWGVSNKGQLDGFMAAQKLTWAIYTSDGSTLLASSAPTSPEYGDTTSWSAYGQEVGTITTKTGAVQKQKFTYSDYLQATGYTVALGETVILTYELSANAPTDDGFGWKFTAAGVLASTTVSSTNPAACRVTGV